MALHSVRRLMELVDRRAFVSATTALLAGCATVPISRRSAHCAPLVPVKVDPSRVIRTVAGLRPYRDAGFVVREVAVANKRVVHNYGHGGAGITLSWGSAKLATDLGLRGHSGAVAVLGCGVMGLSTARLVQDAGFPVTIYTSALPPDTTSNIAGGQFHPFGHFKLDAVTAEWRTQFARATEYSWRRFQLLVGDDYGVRWLPTYSEGDPDQPIIANYPPINRVLHSNEHPFPIEHMFEFDTLYIETGRYLRQLVRDFQAASGRITIRSFASPSDIGLLPEQLVFNCTGLGSRALFGDEDLHPVRGQLAILLPQPAVQYALTCRAGYMFPRPDGIVLGGTFERDQWTTTPEPAAIARILALQKRLFSDFRCGIARTRHV